MRFRLGEEVQFAFARNAAMPGEGDTDGEAGELVVACAFDKGKQNFLGAALLVIVRHVLGQIIGEGVGVEVDEST